LLLFFAAVVAKRKVMPWMCLERCNETIASYLEQIHKNRHLLSGVAFELFNLGPNSTLVVNPFTNVGPILAAWGLETYAMISSFPYPPNFIDWMRQLFANPTPFVTDIISELRTRGLTGVNVDFEPTVNGNQQDAIDYANFMTTFADALHQNGFILTMDISSWNPVWNWTLLSESDVDKIMLMSTYTGNFTTFQKYFQRALQEIDINKLGIGLESINPNTNQPFSLAEMQERFSLIMQSNIHEIDIWDTPIPEKPVNWWPLIKQFVNS